MQAQEPSYAGFWVRTLANVIDALLIMAVTMPILVMTYGWDYFAESTQLASGVVDILVSWVLPPVAVIAFWNYRQATPGKILMSIKIVDAKSGDKPAMGQLIGRYVAYFLSAIPLGMGYLWVAFDQRKQGWHDKLAGTLVVKTED